MNQTIEEFYKSFYEDLDTARRNDPSIKGDDFFTSLMFEYLSDLGEVEDPVTCSYRDNTGIQLNGFQFADDYSQADIFVSVFNDTDALLSVSPTDIKEALNRGVNCYRKAFSGKIDQFNKDSDVFDCVNTIAQHIGDLKEIRVTALTNGVVKNMDLQPIKFSNAIVSYRIWDMERLYKCTTSGELHEPISVDCSRFMSSPLYAVKGGESDKTQVYLAIIPGKFLADLYKENGAKLLERNVRSFLQLKTPTNKGIRETLINDPSMFLAYNNGITVTASSIEKEDVDSAVVRINKIQDFQIVNGGQTTVSLYKGAIDPTIEIDFSKVYVQMKLAVVDNSADMDEVIPNISLYSNSQNVVQKADFSSNDPYHRKLEEISRSTWTPTIGGKKPINWFYERARGQYSEQLGLCPTPAKRREFKENHPVFTKTDLAKALCSWDLLPTFVCQGAQKCFIHFMDRLKNITDRQPSQTYYENCVSKVILFRRIGKLVMDQKFGGYNADIAAYSYFKLVSICESKIDLSRIWKKQALSEATEKQLLLIIPKIQQYIVTAPNGANISEFCKTQKCVAGITELDIPLIDDLKKELLAQAVTDKMASSETKPVEELTPEQTAIVAEAFKLSGAEWRALGAWAKENNQLYSWQRSLFFGLATLKWRNKRPSYKQAKRGLEAREQAIALGFKML